MPETELLSTLHRYWGYSSFRPFQEDIVKSLLAGRDVCVVLPTGGGKSLCYQLPAAMTPGKTAIVVSPLIALMQDQVAQLEQMGIAAAVLNSSQKAGEQSAILQKAKSRSIPAAVPFAGTIGARGYLELAAGRAHLLFRD